MPYTPGFVNQAQLAKAVEEATKKLDKKDVVRVHHSIGADTSGEPSIFLRIVLSDAASQEDTLADVTGNIAAILFDEIRPYENWGLTPYFSFRSQSEQAMRSEPEWA
ncbi:MAG: hypothetical protein WBL61_17035 [Bryobacteraceae bacterium]